MNFYALFAQLTELAVALVLAPLLTGWVNQCRAWLQNRATLFVSLGGGHSTRELGN